MFVWWLCCFFELEAPIDLFEYVFLIGELQYHDCAEVHIFIIDPNSNIMEEITEDISDKSMQSRSWSSLNPYHTWITNLRHRNLNDPAQNFNKETHIQKTQEGCTILHCSVTHLIGNSILEWRSWPYNGWMDTKDTKGVVKRLHTKASCQLVCFSTAGLECACVPDKTRKKKLRRTLQKRSIQIQNSMVNTNSMVCKGVCWRWNCIDTKVMKHSHRNLTRSARYLQAKKVLKSELFPFISAKPSVSSQAIACGVLRIYDGILSASDFEMATWNKNDK